VVGSEASAWRVSLAPRERPETGPRWSHPNSMSPPARLDPLARRAGSLVTLRRRIREVIETGPPSVQKSLVRELVHEIRVHGRDRIQPVFCLPNGERPPLAEVCPPYRMAGLTGFEPILGGANAALLYEAPVLQLMRYSPVGS
jgi:hypothetical protein